MEIILCITKANPLVTITNHALGHEEAVGGGDGGRGGSVSSPSVLRQKVRLKVSISSGHKVKGRKQTGQGGCWGISICFLKGISNLPFAVAAQRLILFVGRGGVGGKRKDESDV